MNAGRIALSAAVLVLLSCPVAAKGLYDPGKLGAPRGGAAPEITPLFPLRGDTTGTPPAPAVPVAPALPAAGFLDTGAASFWEGTWGSEGSTPVVTVAGQTVSYQGSNGRPFAVSAVAITAARIQFQVDAAAVSLTRRPDNRVELVSAVGANVSRPILLCRSPATHCP